MHTIQKHILALKTKANPRAATLAEEAQALLAGAFHQISEKVLEEFKALPGVLEVANLTLDLGRLPPDTWTKEAPYRYEVALREALQTLLAAKAGGVSMASARWQAPEEAAFALWEYYLHQGHLPWWYVSVWALVTKKTTPGPFSLQKLTHWLQDAIPRRFYPSWRALPRQARPWQRILHHFSDEALWQFSEALFRGGKVLAPRIKASFAQLAQFPQEKVPRLRAQLWAWLLENAALSSTERRFWRAWLHHVQQVLQPLAALPAWETYWQTLRQELTKQVSPEMAATIAPEAVFPMFAIRPLPEVASPLLRHFLTRQGGQRTKEHLWEVLESLGPVQRQEMLRRGFPKFYQQAQKIWLRLRQMHHLPGFLPALVAASPSDARGRFWMFAAHWQLQNLKKAAPTPSPTAFLEALYLEMYAAYRQPAQAHVLTHFQRQWRRLFPETRAFVQQFEGRVAQLGAPQVARLGPAALREWLRLFQAPETTEILRYLADFEALLKAIPLPRGYRRALLLAQFWSRAAQVLAQGVPPAGQAREQVRITPLDLLAFARPHFLQWAEGLKLSASFQGRLLAQLRQQSPAGQKVWPLAQWPSPPVIAYGTAAFFLTHPPAMLRLVRRLWQEGILTVVEQIRWLGMDEKPEARLAWETEILAHPALQAPRLEQDWPRLLRQDPPKPGLRQWLYLFAGRINAEDLALAAFFSPSFLNTVAQRLGKALENLPVEAFSEAPERWQALLSQVSGKIRAKQATSAVPPPATTETPPLPTEPAPAPNLADLAAQIYYRLRQAFPVPLQKQAPDQARSKALEADPVFQQNLRQFARLYPREFGAWLKALPEGDQAILAQTAPEIEKFRLKPPVSPKPASEARFPREWPAEAPLQEIYIQNAGLVLLHPFLGQLFQRLALMEKRVFRDDEARQRAMYVLQYLATGLNQPGEEYELALNKVMCGWPLEEPLRPEDPLSPEEEDTCQSLLRGVIQNWKVLKNTRVEGLQVSFLQREGKLSEFSDRWELHVSPKGIDLLLEHLPWGFRTFKLSWVKRVVMVDWPNP
ncbi:MAG: hypothetical protein OHK0053_07810 [Microscillaceae bacterium]